MPSLTDVYLPEAFKNDDKTVTIRGGICITTVSRSDIGELFLYLPIPSPEMYEDCMTVLKGSSEVTDLVIGNNMCPFENVTTFDVTKYPNLKSLKMGNNGFWYVNKVNLTGLNGLESVEIGKNSFTQNRGCFNLKDCPNVRKLKIGYDAFSAYTSCEIDTVSALESIEIGTNSFNASSLLLRSLLLSRE